MNEQLQTAPEAKPVKKKQIKHKEMSARGVIVACIAALKKAGLPKGQYKKVINGGFGTRGETVEGFHLSRVGLSNEITLDWVHPDRHYCYGSKTQQAANAKCKEMEAKCREILKEHGVEFDSKGWITCDCP